MTAGSLNTLNASAYGSGYAWYIADDASFRAWGKLTHDLMVGTGLTQTADTGQINWATATRGTTSGSNISWGYEIWQFTDALQSTAPIYIKLEYGFSYNSNYPQMFITVGSATNGAGTLQEANAGQVTVSNRRAILYSTSNNSYSNTVGGTSYSYGLTDGTGFWVNLLPSQITRCGNLFFYVERTRNFDGTANSDGYVMGSIGSESGTAQTYCEHRAFANHSASTPMNSSSTSGAFVVPGISGSGTGLTWNTFVIGTTWYPVPVLTGFLPRLQGPSQLFLLGQMNDYPSLQQITVAHYGANRQFLFAGPADTSYSTGWGQLYQGANSFLMRCGG